MNTYQFLVHCAFVSLHDEEAEDTYGYFATLIVPGGNLRAAANRLPEILDRRMMVNGISVIKSGIGRTQCCIDEIWELTDDGLSTGSSDTGFSLFKIRGLSILMTLMKFWWIRTFRSHMFVNLTH